MVIASTAVDRAHDHAVVSDGDIAAVKPKRRHAIAACRNDGSGFNRDRDGAAETVAIKGAIIDCADTVGTGGRQDGCIIINHHVAMDVAVDRIGVARIESRQNAGRGILHDCGGIGGDRPRIDSAEGQHRNDAGGWHRGK